MDQSQIDYAKLADEARQHESAIDYSALADDVRSESRASRIPAPRPRTVRDVNASVDVGSGPTRQRAAQLGLLPDERPIDRMEQQLRESGYGSLVDGMRGGGVITAAPGMAQAAPKILQGLARRLYGGLLKPSQALKNSFGGTDEMAGTLLRERVPITSGGLEKITSKVDQSRAAALGMVSDAQAAGSAGVTAKQALRDFPGVVTELRKRADIGQPNHLRLVGDRGNVIVRTASRTGGEIPLVRAQELKETAQEASSGAYRAVERGLQKQLSAGDLMNTAVARGLRRGIEDRVPTVAAQNARTQQLLGGKRAVEDAVERETGHAMFGGRRDLAALLAGGAGMATGGPSRALGAATLMRLLSTPSSGSRLAIGLNEVGRLPIEDATARMLLTLLRERDQE